MVTENELALIMRSLGENVTHTEIAALMKKAGKSVGSISVEVFIESLQFIQNHSLSIRTAPYC